MWELLIFFRKYVAHTWNNETTSSTPYLQLFALTLQKINLFQIQPFFWIPLVFF